MRAAVYARVSTEDQAREEKVSLETQVGDIEAYCKGKGYEVVKPYYIDIQSGSDSMKERPRFEKMLDDARRRSFDVIVAWTPDRLFRNMWPAARLKRTVEETGVDIEAVKQPLDKKMLGLWAWLAEMEIDNFKERSRMGKRGVALKGKVVTRCAPFGYSANEERFPVVNESEAYIVRRIFREYVVENKGVRAIARDLNNERVLLRSQAKYGWHTPYIHRILKDKTYIGQGAYGTHRYEGKWRRQTPEQTHILVPFPPIVDEEIFELAQQKKAFNKSNIRRRPKTRYLLRNLLYCRECGYKFTTRSHWKHRAVTKSGKVYHYEYDPPLRYYQCIGTFSYPDHYRCRKPAELRAEEVDGLIWERLVELLKNPSLLAECIRVYKREAEETGTLEALEAVKQQLSELSLKRQRVIDLCVSGAISESDLNTQLKFTSERKEFYEAEVERLSKQLAKASEQEISLDNLEKLSMQVRDRLEYMSGEEREVLAQLLIHKVWVDAIGNVEIEFSISKESVFSYCNANV